MLRNLMKVAGQNFSKYLRDKPHINVGTIGHVDHGKSTLTSAISRIMSTHHNNIYHEIGNIDKSPEEKDRGITINNTTIEYISDKKHYGHVDCPGHQDYVKNMITGAAKMDVGILVVSAPDGAMPQTKEHVMLCQQIGVKDIIVFLNKIDLMDDPEMNEIVEMEVNEILTKYGYDPEKTKFVRGSALCAMENRNPEIGEDKIRELIKTMDDNIDPPPRTTDKPFIMSIESLYNIEGRGTVVTGTIEQGKIKKGQEIEASGFGRTFKSTIVGIETFRKQMDYAEAGDNVGLLLRGLTKKELTRGMMITTPGILQYSNCAEANVYFNLPEEGGRKQGFYTGFKPQSYFRTADIASEIKLPDNVKIGMPGENYNIQMRFLQPVAIEEGLRFALRDSGKTIGHGIVTKVLPKDTIPKDLARQYKHERKLAEEELAKNA